MNTVISSRKGHNPDHNIWNNNGTWWCHFTVHHSDHTKERVRVSLGTKDREEARRQRDLIMRGTPLIAARLPRRGSQAAPDIASAFCARSAHPLEKRSSDGEDTLQGTTFMTHNALGLPSGAL